MDKEAILRLLEGQEGGDEQRYAQETTVSHELRKLASMYNVPQDVEEILKEASDIIDEQNAQMEYLKLAYDMAANGMIEWRDMFEKAAEFYEERKSPDVIKEAMKMGNARPKTPFGEAADEKNPANVSGMYAILHN